MKNTFLLSLFLFASLNVLIGQAMDERGFYLVESEKFTPPIKELIASFEGQPAEGFLAPDIYGKEHFLNNYRGKAVFLFFYDIADDTGRKLFEDLDKLQTKNKKDLQVIGMAVNSKEDLLLYYKDQKPNFPIIPNGEVFGQMAYGADLGSPRLFAIDAAGIIKRVMPTKCVESTNCATMLNETLEIVK